MKTIPIEIERNLKLVTRLIEIELAFRQKDSKDAGKTVSVKSLVEISGMSERSLRDWFIKYKGINLREYIKKREMEYGARIFRLFPDSTKLEVAGIIGLSSSQALYPFMKRGGIEDINILRAIQAQTDLSILPFRLERLPDCIMFYTLDETRYNLCAEPEYESAHWNKIEEFVKDNFAEAMKVGDVGFAIDRYIENKVEEGVFISGILYKYISAPIFSKGFRDDLGWRKITGKKYAVFSYKGGYEGLSPFYQSVLHTILQQDKLKIDKSLLIMEKYLNSPIDTSTEELITEIWVPILS